MERFYKKLEIPEFNEDILSRIDKKYKGFRSEEDKLLKKNPLSVPGFSYKVLTEIQINIDLYNSIVDEMNENQEN